MGVHLFQMGGPHTTSPPLATALARIEVSAAEGSDVFLCSGPQRDLFPAGVNPASEVRASDFK